MIRPPTSPSLSHSCRDDAVVDKTIATRLLNRHLTTTKHFSVGRSTQIQTFSSKGKSLHGRKYQFFFFIFNLLKIPLLLLLFSSYLVNTYCEWAGASSRNRLIHVFVHFSRYTYYSEQQCQIWIGICGMGRFRNWSKCDHMLQWTR